VRYPGLEPDKEVKLMRQVRIVVLNAALVLSLALVPVVFAGEGEVDNATAEKETVSKLWAVVTAVEGYAVDHGVYPGPTEGWVEVETWREVLEGDYYKGFSAADGWGHAILYWSDGEYNYALVSPGKDGEVEQDWSEPATKRDPEVRVTTEPDADIVIGNGLFVSHPESAPAPY